jgi:hypothetical protein
LKSIVADPALDIRALEDVLAKNWSYPGSLDGVGLAVKVLRW